MMGRVRSFDRCGELAAVSPNDCATDGFEEVCNDEQNYLAADLPEVRIHD